MDNAVSADGVSKSFGSLSVLDRISFDLEAGSRTAFVGPSGCGKSTLLEVVAGLGLEDAGTIEVGSSVGPEERLGRCAWMPQRDCLLPWLDALDNACLPLVNRGVGRDRARGQARETFDRLGLGGFESYRPDRLSGGMRQRVAFARTVLADRDVLLLDEPFASLDGITRAGMQEWIGPLLSGEGRTVLLVTHDLEEAIYLCDRVVVLSGRPARVVGSVESPDTAGIGRLEAIGSPEFVEAHRRLVALLVGRSEEKVG